MEVNTNKMVSLNDTNYHLWKRKIKDLLFVKKIHLLFFVDDNVYNHIASEIHVMTLWEKIESLYASKYGNNKLFLLNSIKFKSWETFKVSITNSALNGVVSLQMVKGSILNEEMRRKTQGFLSYLRYLSLKIREKKHCFLWKKENKSKNGKSKEKDDDDDDCVTTITGDENMWVIDSSATLHFIPRNEFFTSYISGDFGVLKMNNDGVTKVICVGDICLQTNMGVQLWLGGVKHVLNVRFNLIFMHMLDDGGYDNHFGYGKWKLTKDNLVVAKREKISKLYWTKALVAEDSVSAMDMEASLWH
ncbi:hypothetical protein CR513_21582, partial [Mucuna pruriens]